MPENLKDAINGIRAMNFAGVNVTAPHKIEVIQYLDKIEKSAKRFGAVNTIVNENGALVGYNTDAEGLYRYLLKESIDIKNKDILIIGAGGAALPISLFFSECEVKSITIKNRTPEKAHAIAQYVQSDNNFFIEVNNLKKRYDVVINTTSVGMYPDIFKCPIEDFSFIDSDTAVIDLIYNPEETLFLKTSKNRGAKTLNGLGMLIYQGLLAYEHFADIKLPNNTYEIIKKEVFGK